jgi:hypothetical protein
MNVFTYALYRAARLLMTEPEVTQAAQLAREADAGDTAAASVLRVMICGIVGAGANGNVPPRRIDAAPGAALEPIPHAGSMG